MHKRFLSQHRLSTIEYYKKWIFEINHFIRRTNISRTNNYNKYNQRDRCRRTGAPYAFAITTKFVFPGPFLPSFPALHRGELSSTYKAATQDDRMFLSDTEKQSIWHVILYVMISYNNKMNTTKNLTPSLRTPTFLWLLNSPIACSW